MISIIIPVYNNEKHLYMCLNSILKQTHSNFEVICIDDCSTDNSLEILEYFSKKDSRIKILKNDGNKGLGYCRNQGLNSSLGKYVFFLEPDDWIDKNALELSYLKSEELNLDVLIYNATKYYDKKHDFVYEQYADIDNFHNFENCVLNLSASEYLLLNEVFDPPWLKLYNKSFLNNNNIRFSEKNIIQEYKTFNFDILLTAKRISFLNKCLYNHRFKKDSDIISTERKALDNIKIADIMLKSCLNYKQSFEYHKKEILNYIFNLLDIDYEGINKKYKPLLFELIAKLFDKCLNEYKLKEDILEHVNDENILKKIEYISKNYFNNIHTKSKKYIAIDVGGTSIKYALLDESTKLPKINEICSKTKKEEELYDSLDKIISPHLNQIFGIALSFPGLINVEKGIIHTGGSFHWIHDLPLKSILEKRYCKKVWIENDGKCSALAEFYKGNLSDGKNGVFIGLGTGISGGLIINGDLYRGVNGSAGEFSSILDNLKNPNNAKKLYQIGGYRSLIGNYAKEKNIKSEGIDGHKFFEKYHENDEITIKVLNDYSKIISATIINIQTILDVEKFCIGGGISSQDVLINEIKKTVHNFFTTKSSKEIKEPKIEKCFFGKASGCVGALYNFLIMENLIETI